MDIGYKVVSHQDRVIYRIVKNTCGSPAPRFCSTTRPSTELTEGVRCNSRSFRGVVTGGLLFSYHPFESPEGLLTIVDAVAFGRDSFELSDVLKAFVKRLEMYETMRELGYIPGASRLRFAQRLLMTLENSREATFPISEISGRLKIVTECCWILGLMLINHHVLIGGLERIGRGRLVLNSWLEIDG